MSSLKLLQEHTPKSANVKATKTRRISTEDDLVDLFPTARYFQIHLRHIHDNNEAMQVELQQLKVIIATLDNKVDRLLALVSHTDE